MNKVLIDDVLRTRLGDLTQPVELCDASGRVVARVLPIQNMDQYEPISPGITEEELDRRAASSEPRYTTQEVLDQLETL